MKKIIIGISLMTPLLIVFMLMLGHAGMWVYKNAIQALNGYTEAIDNMLFLGGITASICFIIGAGVLASYKENDI